MNRLKLFSIQIIIALGILAGLDFLISLSLDVKNVFFGKESNSIQAYIPSLPNYEGHDWAQDYWKEMDNLGIQYHSYVGWKYKPYLGEHVQVDSLGERFTTNGVLNSGSNSQVFFLGGSTMWGIGTSDIYTIPSLFAQGQAEYRVKNYGQIAYSAYQGYLSLYRQVQSGDIPDLVVSYDGVNDSPLSHGFFQHLLDDQFKSWIEEANTTKEWYSLTGIRKVTSKISEKLNSDNAETKDKVANESMNLIAARGLLDSWLQMKKLCDEIGADFICILQPSAFYSNPNLESLKRLGGNDWHFDMQGGFEYYEDVYSLLDDDRFRSLKPHFVDLTEELDGMPNVYLDFCHLSPNGNEIIAQRILETVSKRVLKNADL